MLWLPYSRKSPGARIVAGRRSSTSWPTSASTACRRPRACRAARSSTLEQGRPRRFVEAVGAARYGPLPSATRRTRRATAADRAQAPAGAHPLGAGQGLLARSLLSRASGRDRDGRRRGPDAALTDRWPKPVLPIDFRPVIVQVARTRRRGPRAGLGRRGPSRRARRAPRRGQPAARSVHSPARVPPGRPTRSRVRWRPAPGRRSSSPLPTPCAPGDVARFAGTGGPAVAWRRQGHGRGRRARRVTRVPGRRPATAALRLGEISVEGLNGPPYELAAATGARSTRAQPSSAWRSARRAVSPSRRTSFGTTALS